MKTLTYSITIDKPREVVFQTMTDNSLFPEWAKAWGEGMICAGEWKEGEHISFFDQTQGGTKAFIEELVVNEFIKTKHVAMVNPKNHEVELTDEMMRKWIGSREDYYFREKSEKETILEFVMITDESFEKMMEAWPEALQFLKDICENQ